jgi:hypothetical protein
MILETRRSYRAATACGPDANRYAIRFSASWIAASEISTDRPPFIAKSGDMDQQIGHDPAYLRPVESEAFTQVSRPVGAVQHIHSLAFRAYNMPVRWRVVSMGIVFESSHAPLHIWLQAIYLTCSSKTGH